MTPPSDIDAIRALLIPATRTVYKTADIRGKTLARAAILKALPAMLDEIERLRTENAEISAQPSTTGETQ